MMGRHLTPDEIAARQERTFAVIERAAIEGRRCPETGSADLPHSLAIRELVQAGRIRIEIHEHNFRVIALLTGPHAGKATARPASGSKPWKIIEAGGTRTRRGSVAPRVGTRQRSTQPSMPRLLTKEELR